MSKSIIITGAAQGIGRALVLHFLDLGWRVAALDRDVEALGELIAAAGTAPFLPIECDVGKECDVTQAFDRVAEWLEGEGLACLVNNAALADPYCGPLEKLTLPDWQKWIDAGLTSTFMCSRSSVPLLLEYAESSGEVANIVNISSTRAVMSEPETFAYAAAKGGVDALTHAMAVSLGPAIRVNAVRPGWIETRDWQKESEREEVKHRAIDRAQHPAGRVGDPRDICEAVEYLIGARFVTGQHINVDGGMSVKMIYED